MKKVDTLVYEVRANGKSVAAFDSISWAMRHIDQRMEYAQHDTVYCIVNRETGNIMHRHDWVVEQSHE